MSNKTDWRKIREHTEREDKKRFEFYEQENYGAITYRRHSKDSPDVIVVPVEIEVPWKLDSFVKHEILD